MKRTTLLTLILILLCGWPAVAKDWAQAMFNETRHDFGVVARGANAEYRFKLNNIYVEDVHIAAVRSTCGCTVPKITKDTLKTYETGEVVAQLDTRRFKGPKEATIIVTIDRPFYAQVELKVCCYIRSDVVLQPGSVQFGQVRQGTSTPQRVTVSYAGRREWQITGVLSAPPFLETRLAEVSRTQQPDGVNWMVTYDLWVVLRENAPPGYFQEHLLLQTNDLNRQAACVPLTADGIIVCPLSVSPSPLLLGVSRPKQEVTKTLVVKGEKPFRIVAITGPDDRFQFKVPADSRALHLIPVQFTGTDVGRVTGKIRVSTDLPGVEPVEITVDGQVLTDAASTSDDGWGPSVSTPKTP